MKIVSPYDAESRYCQKLTTSSRKEWCGYRDHLTETCGEEPHVIVQVATRPAPEQDIDALLQIHQRLVRQGFADLEHFVDAGYITPESIDQAACLHNVVLTGPVRADPRAREHPGFAKADFTPDWDARTLTCPRNVTTHPWKVTRDDRHERLSVLFPKPACRACEARQECTGNTEGRGRHIMLLPQPLQEIQTRVRREQDKWWQHYAIRVGCEATVSETVQVHGLRHCRYRGMAKSHVQHVLIAAGTNIIRLSERFLPGTSPPEPSRPESRLHRLCRTLPA
ncbi:transposase [[Kitasatospora] papulosa]|uniref:transposase n=1 Tax=[Kitasatospora] papulosa TaxID=1464011 RepID=UPI0036AB0CA8